MDHLDLACSGFDAPTLAAPVQGVEFLGIDSGLSGYTARIQPGLNSVVSFDPTPAFRNAKGRPNAYDERGVFELALSWRGKVTFALLERQMAFRDNGHQGNFTTGFGYGLWRMALRSAGIPFDVLLAQQWKRQLGILPESAKPGELKKLLEGLDEKAAKKKKGERSRARRKVSKNLAERKAGELFPGVELRRNSRCKVADDNKCEALLMAELARRLYAGR